MENLYFLIPLFFVVIFCIPINFRIKIAINFNKKNIIFSLFLWKIKIVTLQAFIRGTKIFIKSKKKKQINISFKSKSMQFMENFMTNLKSKIQPKKICIYSRIGLGDAKDTATFCGLVITLAKTIFCYVKNQKPTCSTSSFISPDFKREMQIFCLYTCFSITLFDIVYSLIISLFILRRSYGNRQSKLSWWTC